MLHIKWVRCDFCNATVPALDAPEGLGRPHEGVAKHLCLKCGRYLTAHGDTCSNLPVTHIEGKYVTTRDLPEVGILIRVFMRENRYASPELGDNIYLLHEYIIPLRHYPVKQRQTRASFAYSVGEDTAKEWGARFDGDESQDDLIYSLRLSHLRLLYSQRYNRAPTPEQLDSMVLAFQSVFSDLPPGPHADKLSDTLERVIGGMADG